MCTLPLLRRVCRESYNQPEAVYEKLKRLGMGLVTITDHDSIEVAEDLRGKPDFFPSEEVTCTMPSGTELHVGVYDITERQHLEIQRRRHDVSSLAAYLREQSLFFSVNHVFSSLTGRRDLSDFDWFATGFPAVETLNAAMVRSSNLWAAQFAMANRKVAIGGSDAHVISLVGSAYTEVPGARNKEEFFAGLRIGRSRVLGSSGSYWTLTGSVLSIGAEMMRENVLTLPLAPLALLVPLVTLAYRGLDRGFAQRWMCKVTHDQAIRAGFAAPFTPEVPVDALA